MARTVSLAIETVAARDPARVAVIDRGVHVTYGALDAAARRMAGWLHREGIAAHDTVGLTLREDWRHLVATLALFRLGCRQVTLAGRDPPAPRAALAARLGVTRLLADGAQDALPGLPADVPEIAAIIADAALGSLAPPLGRPGTLVVSSSGTTGRPKLVAIGEHALALQGAMTAPLGTVRFRTVGNEFNTAKRLQLHTLASGGTEVLPNNATQGDIAAVCAAHGVLRVNMAPMRAEALLREAARPGATPWPAGTGITLAGGTVPAALRARLMAALTPQVHVLYGTSETGPVSLAGPPDHPRDPDTVGHPFRGVEVAVVDDGGRALPPGERGHVRIRSVAAATGYLDDPVADARAFHDGWFAPGDIGAFGPDGALILAGRSDDMMNLGTIKIFPAEIEAAAAGFPGVVDCAAFARRAGAIGDIPMLAVVAREDFDAEALLAHCRARLGLRAPRKIIVMPALPRNAQGKVLRRALAEQAAGPPA